MENNSALWILKNNSASDEVSDTRIAINDLCVRPGTRPFAEHLPLRILHVFQQGMPSMYMCLLFLVLISTHSPHIYLILHTEMRMGRK